jgi:uncharacterized membrane protein (Fun14 family)
MRYDPGMNQPQSQAQSSAANPQGHPALVHAMKTMPAWKMKFLGFGLAIGCVGAGTQIAGYVMNEPAAPAVQTAPVSGPSAAPAGSSGFVGNSSQNAPQSSGANSTTTDSTTSSPGLVGALSPFMSHFGFSLFVGILFGVVFRTFLRTALLISALIVGAAYSLTHVLHVNIDMTAVKTDTSQAVSWLTDQGYRLKTMLFHVLPSSTAASVGFILGFKKR